MNNGKALTTVGAIKDKMYDLITVDPGNEKDVNVAQNMGVQLTNSMKKDGVNIIQMQHVDTRQYSQIAVNVLKDLDTLTETLSEIPAPPKVLELTEEELIEDFINYHLDHKVNLADFVEILKVAYVKRAHRSSPTLTNTAKALDVSATTVKRYLDVDDETLQLTED